MTWRDWNAHEVPSPSCSSLALESLSLTAFLLEVATRSPIVPWDQCRRVLGFLMPESFSAVAIRRVRQGPLSLLALGVGVLMRRRKRAA